MKHNILKKKKHKLNKLERKTHPENHSNLGFSSTNYHFLKISIHNMLSYLGQADKHWLSHDLLGRGN